MNPELMATNTGAERTEHVGTSMLEQLADIDERSLSPETARKLLQLRFERSHQERVSLLSAKAREGSLTPAEHDELDEYIHVGDLLAILQSKARQVLKHAGLLS